ncbi:uncharacterized protein PV09_08581 [Verruconis gallopava]|uniref:FAD-binding PCMH-type domain-containing protein n=1 Tax=Verruconis gallopava TaxID=253628 RepID=A0A0D1XC09_9PEZI|nr:uncharacterized protein PV09_08581 [Verruconis gallopava]KIV99775.1 hypothetical protein PV09_08581 [Verruconis gallopava]
MSSLFSSYLLLLLLYFKCAASTSPTCSQLQATRPDIETVFEGQADYTDINNAYWSTACSAEKPACIILPSSAQQLSDVILIINENSEAFAVKSGGHTPNCYSSISGGPLIATKRMNQVVLDNDTQSVDVGPGNRWMDVTAALEGTGMMVVGGRMGEVGVSGLLLGGGLSYLSGQYGWAANNVLEFEVVLSNGTIVKASETENPDLWAALRGGGADFGFVTNFKLRAWPQDHNIWGGIRVFANTETPLVLDAVRSFTANYENYPKAGIIATTDLTLENLLDIWIVFMFYDAPTPPDGVFDAFDAIPTLLDLTQTRTMNDMLLFDNTFVLKGSIYTIATETMPLPNATEGAVVMNGIYDAWHEVANKAHDVAGAIVSMALQPLPKMIIQKAQELGGVVMDFDADVDRIVIELDYSHWFAADHPLIDQLTVETYSTLGYKVKEFQDAGLLPSNVHLPLFMNDAYFKQDYWGRLKPETTAKFKAIQEKYDPLGILLSRTQGFHV